MLPLVTKNLGFKVNGAILINDLSMTLDADGVSVVMGPNGAGKSVLLRLLHGLMEPTSGTIRWAGQAPDEWLRRRQAMMFQRPILLRRSVRANMDFALRQRARGNQREKIDALLGHVGLKDLAERPARRLSGGEQQRLALARALALEPEVLFMDEPAASLDPASTVTIETVVRELKESGTKVVFVTHDVAQARRIADDIVFLHRGRLLEQSDAVTFFEQPSSSEARQYLDGKIII
ncbi:MAG: ABC transporter ATP-binding protein [marine bacterium B5-7]|nr:MAG: ABC transporter ATP-binding protein [marine bacterium B5-7]